MKWVTRPPKTDRIACPWLIRRFIDPDAEILYVPTDQVLAVAEADGAHGFDTPGAEFDHRGNKCTFEVLIDDYDLGGRSRPGPVGPDRACGGHRDRDRHRSVRRPPCSRSRSGARRRSRRPSAPRTGRLRLRRALRLVHAAGRSMTEHLGYDDLRADTVRQVAKLMAAAAITAPKSGGQLFLAGKHNFMETVIVEDPATARAGGVDAGPWKGTP